jgi:hypothetical protein
MTDVGIMLYVHHRFMEDDMHTLRMKFLQERGTLLHSYVFAEAIVTKDMPRQEQ